MVTVGHEPKSVSQRLRINHYHSEGRVKAMLQQITPNRGRRTTKFTPANIQKIKDWVAQGTRREDIAKSLDVTVGSLQVTCSRLGISLRGRRDNDPRRRVESRAFVSNGRVYAGHLQREPNSRAKFQLLVQR